MPFAIRRRRMAKGRTDRLGLTGPDNDGSTPLFLASGAPPICIHSTMAPSSPKSNKASLNPLLLSKGACDAEKHEKSSAKKVHQMMPRASIDALDRIDTKGPSHIARHIRKKNRTRREAVGWGRGFVREVNSELRLSSKKIRHKTLVLHRRCREEETRCLSAPPWTPMLCLQSDCPSGPNQTNSDIGRTGCTKIYVALYFRNFIFFVQCRTELEAFKGRGLQGRLVQK